jgi:hypothetical protein
LKGQAAADLRIEPRAFGQLGKGFGKEILLAWAIGDFVSVKRFLTHLTAEQLEVALQCQDAELNGHLHMAARAMEDLDGDTVFTTEKLQHKQPKKKENSTSKDSEKAENPHQLQALRQILLLVRTHQCFPHLFSYRVCLFGLQ